MSEDKSGRNCFHYSFGSTKQTSCEVVELSEALPLQLPVIQQPVTISSYIKHFSLLHYKYINKRGLQHPRTCRKLPASVL